MKKYRSIMAFFATFLLFTGFNSISPVFADDESGERGEREGRDGGRYIVKENAAYKLECSSCHFLYLPGLLTARSWEAVMKGQNDHFGEKLGLDENTSAEILDYLKANSAEKTSTEWGRKIANSAGATPYLRITEVPWIVKEHRKIKADVYKRPSIGSASNCGACHQKGAEGNFEEDAVSIPKN